MKDKKKKKKKDNDATACYPGRLSGKNIKMTFEKSEQKLISFSCLCYSPVVYFPLFSFSQVYVNLLLLSWQREQR